jgi:hypothetical protein
VQSKNNYASTDALTFISKQVLNTWIFILWLEICLRGYAYNGVLTMSSKPLSIVVVCKAYQIRSEGELHLPLSYDKYYDNI